VQYSGFVLGQGPSVLGGSLTFTGTAVGAMNVGTYTITPAGLMSGNYDIGNVNGTLTIGAWALDGFYSPVGLPNTIVTPAGATLPTTPIVWNAIKGGQTVPLKFRMFTMAGGAEITTVSSVQGFYLTSVGCSVGAEDPVDGSFTSTGGTVLRYDSGQFIQNWDSPKVANRCYRITMTAADGSSLSAFFKAK